MGLPMELTITSRQCGAGSPLAKPKEYKPCFHRELKNTEVEAGDVVVFHCEFSCHPQPDVLWYKGEDQITRTGDKVLIYTEKNDSMLVLADVHEPDSGEYSVVVTNYLGEITSTAELSVIITGESDITCLYINLSLSKFVSRIHVVCVLQVALMIAPLLILK